MVGPTFLSVKIRRRVFVRIATWERQAGMPGPPKETGRFSGRGEERGATDILVCEPF
jgi:hypothetical protein